MHLRRLPALLCIALTLLLTYSCEKEKHPSLQYYEVGIKGSVADWRDSSFIVATANPQLIAEIEAQLKMDVAQRKIVSGALVAGNGGYNTNATHTFKWHFKEDDWHLTDASIEISDGRPYSDVDMDTSYWLNTVKRFSPWNSYIKRKIKG